MAGQAVWYQLCIFYSGREINFQLAFTKVQSAVVVSLTSAWVSHLKGLRQNFLYYGQGTVKWATLYGNRSCSSTTWNGIPLIVPVQYNQNPNVNIRVLLVVSFSFFICPWKTGRIMLCHPSVHLSVCPSVHPLTFCVHSITDTVQDIFIKLGTNINHHQTMCRKQEPTLHLHFLQNYGPLKFFWLKSCLLYNSDAMQNIFMKLCTNINHHQTMCREQEL